MPTAGTATDTLYRTAEIHPASPREYVNCDPISAPMLEHPQLHLTRIGGLVTPTAVTEYSDLE